MHLHLHIQTATQHLRTPLRLMFAVRVFGYWPSCSLHDADHQPQAAAASCISLWIFCFFFFGTRGKGGKLRWRRKQGAAGKAAGGGGGKGKHRKEQRRELTKEKSPADDTPREPAANAPRLHSPNAPYKTFKNNPTVPTNKAVKWHAEFVFGSAFVSFFIAFFFLPTEVTFDTVC